MRITTIVGARPQFVKAGVVSRAIRATAGLEEKIIHTGQHFDANMSDVFFEQLGLPKPDYQLDINGGSHGQMTGRMLASLEEIFVKDRPDCVLVFGDTNSTLAGALSASKMHIPVAHVEAGLRSFNMAMPEEINRICADHVSSILFCPTEQAVQNLQDEGFARRNVHILNCGDVMYDAALSFKAHASKPDIDGIDDDFILVTCHRQENTDDPERLANIVNALNEVHNTLGPVLCPLHPRTVRCIEKLGLKVEFKTLEPVGYLEMLWLLANCKLVMTDSGGLQKEAYFMDKYCITLRDQTEWVELVEHDFNQLVGADKNKIVEAAQSVYNSEFSRSIQLYGAGDASEIVANTLRDYS